ncbi:hypothetical protein HBI56_107300 [Parastagonospora nodorum]|uniref:Uncharacterized protein n=1 Tax=Phaeosphaeria nodorum (strain SN15 / ATCC MYA-4574 / FGSC 10173) TaxID=321614 RepID=A0A7U2FCU7_PHANO|nr:hypothetical protein HBH56_131590 [Parastagonospora nodorum]QRD02881.1 hypothetical protein JI435_418780 [Parastagonospora nodorum SN15]KAH3938209.1 hypothetical protein HBH54_007100 [Parastagonospora nodorum]KAH3949478.1 hypothetical protein HBH53_086540 [Parastagonospora nodorum]KAH3974662.1 hypothetical protein HBH52_135030 [Parastagonospora nodorum]
MTSLAADCVSSLQHSYSCTYTYLDKPHGYDQTRPGLLFSDGIVLAFGISYSFLALAQPHVVLYLLSLWITFGAHVTARPQNCLEELGLHVIALGFQCPFSIISNKNRCAHGKTVSCLCFVFLFLSARTTLRECFLRGIRPDCCWTLPNCNSPNY